MEIVKTIIHTNDDGFNDTDRKIPSAQIWLHQMDPLYWWFLIIACLFTVIVLVLAVVHLYYVLKYVSNERIQTDLYYLVFMYPVTTLCGVIGMFLPRAAPFLYAVALVYFMLCLFIMVTLLFNIFGSRREMAEWLRERNIKISFKVPPVCCLKFLPEIESSDRNLRHIEWLVFQTPIIRTLLEITNVVVFMELENRHNTWFVLSQLAGFISMFVAFYGCYVMVPLGRQKHSPYRFDFIFRTVDIAQCIYTIQKFCFDFASAFDIVQPDRVLPAQAKAQFWASFMLTWEMMVLSALSTYCLRPSKTILFDKYPIIDSTSCCISESQGPCPIQLPVPGNVGSTETIESRVKEDLKLNSDQIIQRFDSI
ncbi:hypothetical protein WR25_24207 [Diploscapter pachys]|uniref:Uncharacterized protein n=1 Tax=Diploscapter pachys TaxID=2018661 RepID=A0A2A2LXJ7_9BILA|nr:hypothetical protein WR25_24207 [Diploscapter pachys]